jgi:hypothetical protein
LHRSCSRRCDGRANELGIWTARQTASRDYFARRELERSAVGGPVTSEQPIAAAGPVQTPLNDEHIPETNSLLN